MQQTFDDLYCERKRQTTRGLFGFVLWIFLETAIGIITERLRHATEGATMQTTLKTLGASALLGLLLILPFAILEIINRRSFNEGFPFMLFFVLWLNLFAMSLILLPIAVGLRSATGDVAQPARTQSNTLFTKPWSAAMMSAALLIALGILPLLDAIGWLSLDRLFNGPNPEVAYLPGQIISLGLIVFPVAAGVIAGRPIVHTLRARGSLFAHPIHLLIVVSISFLFGIGVVGLIVDQWPCFMGVPNCD
jgi:magnesium-transporting ATPase (P-type)